MKALNRKLLRDLRLMWSQALTIALVVASGVAGFITTFSAYDTLAWSRDLYYTDARFADVFASLKRAPMALQREIEALPGVAAVETSLTQMAQIRLPLVSDPIVGRLVGLDPARSPELNQVQLRRGQMVAPHASGALEALVSEGFASARGLRPGDTVGALINGRQERLLITGIALSPETIFAGLGGSPDQRGFGVFWVDHRALAAAADMAGAFNQVALRLAPGASQDEVIAALDRLLARHGGLRAGGRDEQLSHRILESEIQEQRVLGTVLPAIFLGVAAFLLNVVLGRQIATQREQVAALKALGYDDRAIGLHYLRMVLAIVLVGLLPGLGLGALLGHWFVGVYADVFRFPELHYRVRPELLLAAAAVTLLAAMAATFQAIRATVRLAPAEAMRPAAPAAYRALLVERLGWYRRLPNSLRMVLRNLSRRPLRAGLTVLGVAMAVAIVITGAFWKDAILLLVDTQFTRVLRGDITLALTDAVPASVQQELARLPHVTATEGSRAVAVRLSHGSRSWRGSLQGRPIQGELQRIVDLRQQVMDLPAHGLLLTDRLAARLDVRPGDSVRVERLDGNRDALELTVSATVAEMMGMNAYIERRSLNRLLGEGDRVNQVTLAVERGHETALLEKLGQLPRVAAAMSKATLLRNIQEVTARNLSVFSLVLTLFATVIAVGVVYNSARIALAERTWELASLRVLGFTRAEVSGFLLGELAIVIALATPLGLLAGRLLSGAIVQLIQTDEFFFPLAISPATYAFAALTTLAAGGLSAWVVRRRVDALDLVGVLKTRE
ncbi:MAG: FtsX-like permease family protein [Rhodoferax sp.]|nr:FtsX-like permease family protein [Rhodoferax sp.]